MKRIPLSHRDGHESLLVEWCNLNNTTLARLAADCELSTSTVYDLAYGLAAPVYVMGPRNGKIKPIVNKLEQHTGWSKEKLFPKYFCAFNNENVDLHPDVIEYLQNTMTDESFRIDKVIDDVTLSTIYNLVYNKCDMHDISVNAPLSIRQRNGCMFIGYFYYGYTFVELGKQWNRSANAVRIVVEKLVRVIRKWIRSIDNVTITKPKESAIDRDVMYESDDAATFIKFAEFVNTLPRLFKHGRLSIINPAGAFMGNGIKRHKSVEYAGRSIFQLCTHRETSLYAFVSVIADSLKDVSKPDMMAEHLLRIHSNIIFAPNSMASFRYVISKIVCERTCNGLIPLTTIYLKLRNEGKHDAS